MVRLANAAAATLVFRGRDDEFVDRKLRNGARYRYELTAIDQAGNRSRASVSAVPTASPLLEPARGARLSAPPLLVWEPVKRAVVLQRPALPRQAQGAERLAGRTRR